jgi:two-component system, NtrC family, sensor histidine kinase HydH
LNIVSMQHFTLITAAIATTAGALFATISVRRIASALALPLALVSVDQFAWNLATVGFERTGALWWKWLGAATAPLFVPFVFHFVLAVVGRRRAWRTVLRIHYGVALALSGIAVFGLIFAPNEQSVFQSQAAVLATSGMVSSALALALVGRHMSRSPTATERKRGATLFAALGAITLFSLSDLLSDLGYPVPSVSSLGSFFFHCALAVLAFQLRLVERSAQSKVFSRAAALGTLVACALTAVAALSTTGQPQAQTSFGLGFLGLLLIPVTSRQWVKRTSRDEQLMQAAQLGRFSMQIGHDLKNPLAAAVGALQFLQEEYRNGRSLEPHASFLELIEAQLGRLNTTIERYQRLSRVEPQRGRIEAAALVQRVMSLQSFGTTAQVSFHIVLAGELPVIEVDADLVSTALENLIQNATEAIGQSAGNVTVSAERFEDENGQGVALAVTDDGPGMDSRTREHAFDAFFTTKASGSGLGLAWVDAVVSAHGGSTQLTSEEGRGTQVELRFPVSST